MSAEQELATGNKPFSPGPWGIVVLNVDFSSVININAGIVENGGLIIVQVGTLTGDVTLANPTNPTNRQRIEYVLKQDGVGNRALNVGSKFRLPTSSTLTFPINLGNNPNYASPNAKTRIIAEYDQQDDKWDILLFLPDSGKAGVVIPAICNGRLTTESGVPVSSSDRTAQGTIYFTPYGGNHISLYSGTAWADFIFSEFSLVLSALTSGKNYDVFVYNNSGTPALELSAPWTTDNSPADVIALQDGISVKSANHTRRWVGTIRTTGTTTTEDSAQNRFVWNAFNQVSRQLLHTDIATAHTYATQTFRPWNNGVGGPHGFSFISGDLQVFNASLMAEIYNNAGGSSLSAVSPALNGAIAAVQFSGSSAGAVPLWITPSTSFQSVLGLNNLIVYEFSVNLGNFDFYTMNARILN